MIRRFVVALAVVIALAFCCSGAMATVSEFHLLLAQIADPSDPIVYTLSSLATLELSPPEGYNPEPFVSVLQSAALMPASLSETPEGEYLVLSFPEIGICYYFYPEFNGRNYIRQVGADENEELFRVKLPEEILISPYEMIAIELDAFAAAHGISKDRESVIVPETGWVRDGLNGVTWRSQRVLLGVELANTQCYHVHVFWGSPSGEAREWIFVCSYDPEDDDLKANYILCHDVRADQNGVSVTTPIYEGDSQAYFTENEDGEVELEDPGDDLLEDMVFERSDSE